MSSTLIYCEYMAVEKGKLGEGRMNGKERGKEEGEGAFDWAGLLFFLWVDVFFFNIISIIIITTISVGHQAVSLSSGDKPSPKNREDKNKVFVPTRRQRMSEVI